MADGNGFTNKEILLRLEAKVDAALAAQSARIDAAEGRIGALERVAARAKGALALAVLSAPLLVSLFVR